ncbi:MAG: hypothetical protein U0359_12350 [Byssovorax sp.]
MRRSVALVILAALATLPATFACSGDVGVVPQCEPDVTDAGIQIVEDGCSGFAICLNDAGNRVPAAECCKDQDGKPLTGGDLELCLYGYGAVSAPGGGSGTTSSSSSGGGAGGGP